MNRRGRIMNRGLIMNKTRRLCGIQIVAEVKHILESFIRGYNSGMY